MKQREAEHTSLLALQSGLVTLMFPFIIAASPVWFGVRFGPGSKASCAKDTPAAFPAACPPLCGSWGLIPGGYGGGAWHPRRQGCVGRSERLR